MSNLPGEDPRRAGKRAFPRGAAVAFAVFAVTVFLYLIRLEAHTRADIFLPVDYHAVLRDERLRAGVSALPKEAEGIDALDASYQRYARQEDRPYTIRQDLLLSRLAYLKAPAGFRGEVAGVTLGALCEEIERILLDTGVNAQAAFGRGRAEILSITAGIAANNVLTRLEIRAYREHPSGLAAYVFAYGGEITMALRGTDDALDMADNLLLLPLNLSVQYAPMRALLAAYGDAGRIWLTGHSKGGHNAIYAASIDVRCRATGFNAPGFGIFLSDAQHDGLDGGVNYVMNGDATGFLLFHLERRIVLESTEPLVIDGLPSGNRHRLDNFFSVDALTVAKRVQPLSIALEWATQLAWLVLVFLAAYWLLWLVRRAVFGCIRRARRAGLR